MAAQDSASRRHSDPGKKDPTMTMNDVEALRAQYRESYHRKTAARRAKGLCVKCGRCPPTPGRTRCEPCGEKQRAADLERYHRRTAERCRGGDVPQMRQAPARARAQPVRAVPGEGRRRRPGQGRPAAHRRSAPERPRQGPRL